MTTGHLDIVTRAVDFFDKLIIAIYDKPAKPMFFTIEERVALAKEAVADMPKVCVKPYSGLTVEFIHSVGGKVMIRGLRVGSDFETEFEMEKMNKKLAPDIEMLCLMASSDYQCISSKLIKEVATLQGCLTGLVPDHVAVALKKKLSEGIH
jgi:pantetheine-phosphate adenylyltransferase